jgi:hypothetical protein
MEPLRGDLRALAGHVHQLREALEQHRHQTDQALAEIRQQLEMHESRPHD